MKYSELHNGDNIIFANGNEKIIALSNRQKLWFHINRTYIDNDNYDDNSLGFKGSPDWNIIRVERQIEGVFYPIWTKIDGDIDKDVEIIKINNRYYTRRFIEEVFTQLKEWRSNIL